MIWVGELTTEGRGLFFCKRSFIVQAYTWSVRNLDKARFLKEIMSGQFRCPFSPSSPSYGYGYSLYRRSIRLLGSSFGSLDSCWRFKRIP